MHISIATIRVVSLKGLERVAVADSTVSLGQWVVSVPTLLGSEVRP